MVDTKQGNPSSPTSKRLSRPTTWFVVGLLLVHHGLLLHGVKRVYLTADEPAYIAGGYALWSQGSRALPFLAQRGYPPLLAGAHALLLYAENPSVPVATLPGWASSFDQLTAAFKPYLAPIAQTLFLTRLPMIWLMGLLAAVVFRWGKGLWGWRAGVLALWVLVFDPTLLANGRLAHTDAGIVALGTLSLYAVWRWATTHQFRWAIASGLGLGFTLLAKVSGVFYVMAAMVAVLLVLWQQPKRRIAAQGATMLAVAGLLFWGGYAFTWGPVAGFPLPVPAPAYWESILYLRRYSSEIFALGRQWPTALWWYYPVSFLLKNPLPLLAGVVLGGSQLVRPPVRWGQTAVVGALPLIYTITALLIGMNIGYRHLLPVHPYLYLLIGGGVAGWAGRKAGWRRWLVLVGCVAYGVGTVRAFPRELSFFNALIGGSANGYRYLSDSNVDWGQTPPEAIAAYVAAHPEVQTEPPETPFRPAAGRYLLTASALRGVGRHNPYAYGWFQQQQPIAVLYDALLVYEVPPLSLGWVAQCERPLAPLPAEVIWQQTGVADLPIIPFDCSQSWVYPGGGGEAGMYALHDGLFTPPKLQLPSLLFGSPTPAEGFMARRLAGARLSFVKGRADETQPFVLYEATQPPALPDYPENGRFAPVSLPPAAAEREGQWRSRVSFNDTVTFLGSTLTAKGQVWEVESWWRVEAGPVERPFSLMAHLVASDGAVIAVADGLGVSPLALRPSDIVVQNHRFPAPPAGHSYWLKAGVYWLDTIEQWPVDGTLDANAVFVPLSPH